MIALLAPGQGSQTEGMLSPWLQLPGAADQIAAWSKAADLDLARLGTTASTEEITDTAVAQPLIVAATLLAHQELARRCVLAGKDVIVAGHSVGEIAAYAIAGVIAADDAVALAATIVAMRMAGATDNAVRGNETEALLRRIGLAAAKYWVCKRSTAHAAEALECLGGNGYVEDSGMPRLYREAPLMGIWEGSGNVSALDTLRAMATRPACVEVLFDELARSAGQDPRLDGHVERLRPQLGDLDTIGYRARKIAEDICLALQGSLLVRHGHPAVAEAFLATRLGGQWGGAYGTMPAGLDLAPILERALVKG